MGCCRRAGANILLPLLFTLVVGLVFLLPLIMAAVEVGKEARGVVDWVLHVQHDGLPVADWVARLPFGSQQLTAWWQTNLADPAQSSELLGRINREQLFSVSRHLGTEVLHRIVLLLFTLLTLFFLFRDGDRLAERLLRASRLAFGPGGERVGRQIVASVHGTVDGLVLVGIGEGVAIWVGYLIAGAPQPTLLGALTAVAATIPFGAPLVFVVASLLILSNGSALAAVAAGRLRVCRGVRRRPLHPPVPDRRRDEAAVPVGAAGHTRRDRDLGRARPVRRAGGDGGADPAMAGMDRPAGAGAARRGGPQAAGSEHGQDGIRPC